MIDSNTPTPLSVDERQRQIDLAAKATLMIERYDRKIEKATGKRDKWSKVRLAATEALEADVYASVDLAARVPGAVGVKP